MNRPRVALTSRGNLALVDLRSRRERLRDFAADMLELALTIAGTAGICTAFLFLLICAGFVK